MAPLGASAFVVSLVALGTGGLRFIYGVFVDATISSYAAFFLFGFPTAAYLRRRKRLSARNVLVAGVCLGAGLDLLWPPVQSVLQGSYVRFSTDSVPLMTVSGLVVAVVFALVAGLFKRQLRNDVT